MKNYTLQTESLGLFALLIVGLVLVPLQAKSQDSLLVELVDELGPYYFQSSAIIDSTLFLAGSSLVRFDIRNSAHPVEIDNLDLPCTITSVVEVGKYLYLVGQSNDLYVVESTWEGGAVIIDTLHLPDVPYCYIVDLDQVGSKLLVTYVDNGSPYNYFIVFVDVSIPADPGILTTFDPDSSGYLRGVCATTDRLFILESFPESDGGFSVYDITNLEQIEFLESGFSGCPGWSGTNCATVNGFLAYYYSCPPSVRLFDITNVEQPTMLDSIAFSSFCNPFVLTACVEMQIIGNRLFMILSTTLTDTRSRGVTIVDVSEPSRLHALGSSGIEWAIWYDDWASDPLTVNGEYFYWPVDSTLRVYQMTPWINLVSDKDGSNPTQFSLQEAYPNPFNPSTRIMVNLPMSVELKVVVYNLLGQQVAELANNWYQMGYHSFVFDGSRLPSGTYFVRATTAGQMDQVRKIVLLK